ncbi:MAG: hypothetical protein HYR76_05870 [Ignavibacteria bacterium]|nr:hypothetical protein [Ignavibacteria bacterium]MBI3765187.1 hypothetical protein [Ignavibacteriales bacterium]
MNTLYLGDYLYVLRENVPDESVDYVFSSPILLVPIEDFEKKIKRSVVT